MSKLAKFFGVLCVLALAGGVGVLFGWYKTRQGDVQPVTVAPGSNMPMVDIAPVAAAPGASGTATHPRRTNRDDAMPSAPPPPPGTFPPWGQQLDEILLADTNVNAKADRLLAMLTNAPTNAQVELSQHLVNLTQDDHYDGVAQLLTNADTPKAVSTVLMNDLLNRNNTLKLPMLLAVARDDSHPLKDQAREMLELLLQTDDGTNWDQWSAAIDTWLQDNPQ